MEQLYSTGAVDLRGSDQAVEHCVELTAVEAQTGYKWVKLTFGVCTLMRASVDLEKEQIGTLICLLKEAQSKL